MYFNTISEKKKIFKKLEGFSEIWRKSKKKQMIQHKLKNFANLDTDQKIALMCFNTQNVRLDYIIS